MKRILSSILCTLLICSSFGVASFADSSVFNKVVSMPETHDLFVSIVSTEDYSTSEIMDLETIDNYTMDIPLTEKEFNNISKYNRDELKDYLLNQNGLENLASDTSKNIKISKKGETYLNLSLDQAVGVLAASTTQTIDAGVLTTSITVADNNTTTNCAKKITYNFSWSPSPLTSLTDSAAVGHTGESLGLTNYTAVSGYVQRMLGGSTTYQSKETIAVSLAGSGVETHAIDPRYTDIKLKGAITFTVSNPKTAVTANAYFVAFGQYAHTQVGFAPTASVGTGGFSWSVGPTTIISKSTQVSQSSIKTY